MMVNLITSVGERLVRLVVPVADADAAAACYSQYSHCGQCQFWQNEIIYDRICNGVFQYRYGAGCGTCAA
ncbi:hypothetical protein I0C86_18050 [Plantactinospora sp. S1510]|uniref:Uncharacterized protein n=1 Tax=Plantactinospora alkalitolerans TaxID=2789879 RepID=A0ABS0GXM4_9ACTN|nr:hypothetical protein [Plantactinospora alkalitolerans]MBF9130846.1 hypothetical protein [Plantactinospora alkalitolerans]